MPLDTGHRSDDERRLISPGEAAAILRVSEHAVLDWIDRGLISYSISTAGQPEIAVRAAHSHNAGAVSSHFTHLELGRDIDPGSRALFQQELQARRRELELDGLDYGAIDVTALAAVLAARFAAVVPEGTDVSVSNGMVVVGGSGIDVAGSVANDCEPAAERIRALAERALEMAGDALSELTTDPWPAKSGQFRGGFPPAHATLVDGQLCLSYGDPEHPLLTLEPIELSAVLTHRD